MARLPVPILGVPILAVALAAMGSSVAAQPAAAADTSGPTALAVLDMELIGDLGDPSLQAEHRARQQLATERLREKLEQTPLYDVVDNDPARDTIERLQSQQYLHACNGCEVDIARQLGAAQVLVPWVYRVSNLVLTLNYELTDVATGQRIRKMAFDFRGDNDSSWTRAVEYMVRDLQERAASSPPKRG